MHPDDTMDTLDTSLDVTALDDDATPVEDALDTEQMPALDPEDRDVTALNSITGGMHWQDFRPSTNVENRRSPRAVVRDRQWWDRSAAAASVRLPPRRPQGL